MSSGSQNATPKTECAFIPSTATAIEAEDGTWEAHWPEPDGRGGSIAKSKPGFESQAKAMDHARRVETAAKLNRC